MNLGKHSQLVLRLGLAFVFGWFGIDKFLHLQNWYGWIPQWMGFVPRDLFLYAVAVVEVILAILLIGLVYAWVKGALEW